jgi:hypothetical protein
MFKNQCKIASHITQIGSLEKEIERYRTAVYDFLSLEKIQISYFGGCQDAYIFMFEQYLSERKRVAVEAAKKAEIRKIVEEVLQEDMIGDPMKLEIPVDKIKDL